MTAKTQDIEISELQGFEQVADIINGRPLFHFSFVRSFRYFVQCEDGRQWSEIEFVMEELDTPHAQIGIRFERVSVDKFSGFGQIMGLFFEAIHPRGWESHRFEVGDYEDGRIHLFCHEISMFAPPQCGLTVRPTGRRRGAMAPTKSFRPGAG
jgi:hypothetical protein